MWGENALSYSWRWSGSMDQLCQAFLSLLHRGNGCVEGPLFGPQNDLILLTLLLCDTVPAHQLQTGMQ